MAARGTSWRPIRSSRRRASRARWSSSTRDTLLFHSSAFNMAPSIARTIPAAAGGGATTISRRSRNPCDLPHIARDSFCTLCVGDRQARANCQCGELIDRIAAGAPVGKLRRRRGARAYVGAIRRGIGRITAPGSSWPQSTRSVQRKRRPTSNVDSMMVLRARRGATGSKYVTLRGGLRRAIPFLLVRSGCGAQGPQFYAGKPP